MRAETVLVDQVDDDLAGPISPELALVCPTLRAAAIARLPEIDPNALFTVMRAAPVPPAAAGQPPSMLVALSVYFLVSLAKTLVAGVAVAVAVVAILVAISLP